MLATTLTTTAVLGFAGPLATRPKFHANDTRLDVMNIVQHAVEIEDARLWDHAPSLDREGFAIYPHRTRIGDFRQRDEVDHIHPAEIQKLLLDMTGADEIIIVGGAGLRFGERSQDSGALDNSRPARFVHIDVSDKTAADFFARVQTEKDRPIKRVAQYNVWRALTPPPQDVPLAVCDARSLSSEDLMPADAMFDRDGAILFSFEALTIRYNPKQRWAYFSNMTRDEALVFKTHDTDSGVAHHVPHGAFDDPNCPPEVEPRSSVEMRGMAIWYE